MAQPAPPSDFDRDCHEVMSSCACESLRRTSRAVTARYQEGLRAVGVSAAQLPILVAAHVMGPAPVGSLATQLLMDRTTLTRNLVGLRDAGLVTVDPDVDRRVRLVALTPAGRRTLRRGIRAWRDAQAQMVSLFGSERMSALVGELGALAGLAAPEQL
ncbi:MAG TPA: MarR family winged helix-turn-helix transcriptional regulator [Candidatus Dormibacteraeota bacterium]|nr:MarR family winged helix-turn-helix transcriptional regulator [Candidatus Dormibacteraeota bacterium]